jgi:uncharacterized protein
MFNISGYQWLIVGLAALLIGVSKTGIPGIGILAVLLMAMVIPARLSVGIILPMLIVGDVFAVSYYRRHAVWPHLVRIIPWAAAGIIIGWKAMNKVNDRQLGFLIGLIVLGMLVLNHWRNYRTKDELSIPTQWWFAAIIGLLAGITTMMANAAGPIMIIYLMAMRLPKNEFLGTGAWYFLLLNCFKVPFNTDLGLINGRSLVLNLVSLPMIVLGAVSGVPLARVIPEKMFGVLVQLLALAAALKLLIANHPF